MQLIIKVLQIIPKQFRVQVLIISLLSLLVSILELVGIMSVVPILNFLFNEDNFFNYFEKYELIQPTNLSKDQILLFIIFTLLIFFILKSLIIMFFQYFNFKTIFLIKTHLAKKILENYIYYKYKHFFKKKSSEMIRNISKEVERVCTGIMFNFISIATDLFLLIFLLVSAVYFKLSFSLISIFFLLIVSFFIIKFLKKNINFFGKIRLKLEAVTIKNLQEIFFNFKEIKIFEKEYFFLRRFHENNLKKANSEMWYGIYAQIPRILIEIIAIISFFIFILFLNNNFEKKEIMPILGVYAVALFRLVPSVSRIVTSVQNIRFDLPALDQIYNEVKKLNKTTNNVKSKFIFNNEIIFKNVSFSYPGHKREILKNINLKIKKNTVTGIFGPTGSGKTTLVEIFSGLLKPSHGVILVDNKKNSNYSSILKKISYVPQTVNLIDDTFKQNIVFGLNKIDIQLFKYSLKVSCLDTFVKKIKNYNTNMGEFGKKISGGEKQRVGIARALYKNSEILILDEATSALDLKTEKKLLKNLKQNCKNKTILFITHKKENLVYCDNIVKL